MARLTVILALACAGLASAGTKTNGDPCKKDKVCEEGLYCLRRFDAAEGEKGVCSDQSYYCNNLQSTHDGIGYKGTCSPSTRSKKSSKKSKSSKSRSSSGGGGVRLPTGQSFNLPIQIMCMGDSITYGGQCSCGVL